MAIDSKSKSYNLNDIINIYMKNGKDFGFSSSEDSTPIIKRYEESASNWQQRANEYASRLHAVEKLIAPLLVNLIKSADKPNIYWPDREEQVKKILDELLSHTRADL